MAKTEKVLYFDCFAGICGDMTLAALVDLGVPEDHLRSELEKLALPGWNLRFARDSRKGIGGTRADVDLLPTPRPATQRAATQRAARALSLAPPPSAKAAAHEHRAWSEIRAMIEGSGLGPGTKARAVAIFGKLAVAEAKVHGSEVESVAFHEVGAVDSIVDIVGAAICLEYLKPDRVLCGRIELGGGFVKCQHGLMPVPAPAVAELLKGAPVKSGAVQKETTTPTGAAILMASVDEFTESMRFRITRVGYGIGHRDDELPNVLRVVLGEAEAGGAAGAGGGDGADGVLLECNIDDMSPEAHGHVLERLFASGADDVWLAPIVMKKNRAAVALSAICALDKEEALAEAILRETTTFGLRRSYYRKTALERRSSAVSTSLGEVRVKTGFLGGHAIKSKAEYEDLRRIADERGMSVMAVRDALKKELP
jgi:pyridinium-3,5-bisthiocarboxylic acid mononucleotide nickel chelatase